MNVFNGESRISHKTKYVPCIGNDLKRKDVCFFAFYNPTKLELTTIW